jgi:hypothetical protein
MKFQVVEIVHRSNNKLMKWKVYEMASISNGKLMKGKLTKLQIEKRAS